VMKRSLIILAALVALCLTAYFLGRAYQRSHVVVAPPHAAALPAPTASPRNLPADFGNVVYRDLAKISFADLYETLRDATPQFRTEWLREIEQTPESPRKIAALCGFFRALVQSDPRMAADLVIQLPRHRGPAMEAMVAAAPPSAMPDLAEMLLKVPSAARNFGLTDHLAIVIDEWAQVDPDAVVRFLDQHKELPLQEYGESFVHTWAGLDAEAARKWMDAHSEYLSELGFQSWLTGWFKADSKAATAFALAHVDDKSMGGTVTSLASEIFQQDQVGARQFVQRLPNSKMRRDALQDIAYLASWPDWSEDAPPSAVANLIVQFPTIEWPEKLSDVLEEWRRVAAVDLLDWISRMQPEIQAKVIDNFPAPDPELPEPTFLPVLQLPPSNARTKLLRRLITGLESENQSASEVVAKLKISPAQKEELESLLPED
jgi:hypothetical protein